MKNKLTRVLLLAMISAVFFSCTKEEMVEVKVDELSPKQENGWPNFDLTKKSGFDGIETCEKTLPIAEFENLAKYKDVRFSSVFDWDSFHANKTVDGNMSTLWGTHPDYDTDYIVVDLGSKQSFNKIKTAWFSGFQAKEFHIFISDDYENWELKFSSYNNTKVNNIIDMNASARYVGILCAQKSHSVYAMLELEVLKRIVPPITYSFDVNGEEKVRFNFKNIVGKHLNIDWGDGNSIENVNFTTEYKKVEKLYNASGSYTIKINGDYKDLHTLDVDFLNDNSDIKSINIDGATSLTSFDTDLTDNTQIDFTYVPIKFMELSGNGVANVDYSPLSDNLIELRVFSENAGALDLSNMQKLLNLYIYSPSLMELNIAGCTNLKHLECENGILTNLDLSGCTNLSNLHCQNNDLSELNLADCNKITDIWCENNYIKSISWPTNLQSGKAVSFVFRDDRNLLPTKSNMLTDNNLRQILSDLYEKGGTHGIFVYCPPSIQVLSESVKSYVRKLRNIRYWDCYVPGVDNK